MSCRGLDTPLTSETVRSARSANVQQVTEHTAAYTPMESQAKDDCRRGVCSHWGASQAMGYCHCPASAACAGCAPMPVIGRRWSLYSVESSRSTGSALLCGLMLALMLAVPKPSPVAVLSVLSVLAVLAARCSRPLRP